MKRYLNHHPRRPSAFLPHTVNMKLIASLLLLIVTDTHGSGARYNLRRNVDREQQQPSSIPEHYEERVLVDLDNKMFAPLTCNIDLSVDDCNPSSAKYDGKFSNFMSNSAFVGEQVVIPCGKCVVMDITDGSTIRLDGGVDIHGMLYFPSTANVTLETTHIFVQGILKMDPPSIDLGNKVRVRMVGHENQFLIPHSENAMACASTGCDVGKKAIAVAGGRMDIRGLENEDCPSWTKLQSLVPISPGGVSETTGCSLDYDMVELSDGSFNSYDVDMTNPDGVYFHRQGEEASLQVKQESNGNKYLHQSGRFDSSSGIGIRLDTSCVEPPSKSNNKGLFQFNMRYRSNGDGSENGLPRFKIWGGGSWVYPKCPKPVDNQWVTCNAPLKLTKGELESSMNLEIKMQTATDKSIDYDDIKVEAVPLPHEATVEHPFAPMCWRANDEVAVTYSRMRSWWHQSVKTIKSVDLGIGALIFSRSDSIEGRSLDDLDDDMKVMASEVAWLSRPIIFEAEVDGLSSNDHGSLHGGHLIILHSPEISQHIEGVELRNFGQQGVRGRYPVHFQMSRSAAGSVIRKNVIRDSKQRCIVIQASHDILVEDNVAFDTFGHCYMTEDGGETGNSFFNNIGILTRNQEIDIGSTDDQAATLWISNPQNHYVGNVAAGSQSHGIWFDFRDNGIREPSQSLPENIGATKPMYLPLYTFKGNTAHSCGKKGVTTYARGYRPTEEALFEEVSSYHNEVGAFIHFSSNIRYKDSFFAFNKEDGIFNYANFGMNTVEHSTFILDCDQTGVHFTHDGAWQQIHVHSSEFINICTSGTSWPLKITAPPGSGGGGSKTTYDMPMLKDLSYVDTNYAVQMINGNTIPSRNIFIEDGDGSMNPLGEPGFFLNDFPHMTAFIDDEDCSAVDADNLASSSIFCVNVCLRRVLINTGAASDYQLVVTSKSDPHKSHVYDKSTAIGRHFEFDIVLPLDEYSIHFIRLSDEIIVIPTFELQFDDEQNAEWGHEPPLCEFISEASLHFECPEDYHLSSNNMTCHSSKPLDETIYS